MEKYEKIKTLWVLFATLAILLAHHFWGHGGHFGFDDMTYAQLASQVANGSFQVTGDHYTYRWAILVLSGFFYKILGINDFSSAIPAMLATLITAGLVWKMAIRLPTPARLFAVGFTITSEWVFFYSNKIMPDVPVMCCLTLALFAYWKTRFDSWQEQPSKAAGAMIAALFAGFLFKETVILALPAFGILWASDWINQRCRTFWKTAFLMGLGALIAYFIVIYAISGTPLGRFKSIAANSYFSNCSYDLLPIEHLWRRIGYELWVVFFQTGVALGLGAIIVGWALPALRSSRSESRFFLFIATLLLLLCNFMTTSPRAYVPLCTDIRHYLFVVPWVALAAASVFNAWLHKINILDILLSATATLSAVIAYRWYPDQFILYLAGGISTLLIVILKTWPSAVPAWVFWLIISAPLGIKPLQVMRAAQKSNYADQKSIVNRFFATTQAQQLTVISNPVECNIDQYLMRFDTSRVRFMSFRAIDTAQIARTDSVVLLINGSTAYLSGMDWDDMPEWVRQPDSSRVLLGAGQYIEVYGINKADLLRRLAPAK